MANHFHDIRFLLPYPWARRVRQLPADMWSAEDNLLFLKYSPNARDRCYHSMQGDLACRPHDLLNLKIKDLQFKEVPGGRYAEFVVNGKTGERELPLIDSIPYVTQWLSMHPQSAKREAFLIPNLRNSSKAVTVGHLCV